MINLLGDMTAFDEQRRKRRVDGPYKGGAMSFKNLLLTGDPTNRAGEDRFNDTMNLLSTDKTYGSGESVMPVGTDLNKMGKPDRDKKDILMRMMTGGK